MHVYIAHKHIKTCYYQKRENTLCRLAGSLSAAGLLKFFSFHKNIQHFKKNNVALWLNPNFLKPLLCANLPLWGNCLVVFWLSQVFPSSNHLIFCFGAKKVESCGFIWCHRCCSVHLCTLDSALQCYTRMGAHILASLMAALAYYGAVGVVLANCWKHEYSSALVLDEGLDLKCEKATSNNAL